MKSKISYNTQNAGKLHDNKYYQSCENTIQFYEEILKEKENLKTKNEEFVTEKLNDAKNKYESEKIFEVLAKIYEKNKEYAFGITNELPMNSNLLSIISNVSILRIAYGKVRKNKGAMTEAYPVDSDTYYNLDIKQRNYLNKTFDMPDKISNEIFQETSELIKMGKYPWGTSRRIYLDKPGKKAKRPITIPPFMDKVLQEAIKLVLTTIYEPYFEKMNSSFGFRPFKGVHNSIYALTCGNTAGLTKAIKGDIKAAYDKVDRTILINCLEKKIKDKKFIAFIKNRLNYQYYDTEEKIYKKTEEGIPQGGADSPYLWNIYMLGFDEYIQNEIKGKFLTEINSKYHKNNKEKDWLYNKSIELNKRKSTLVKIFRFIWKEKRLNNGKYLTNLKKLNKLSEIKWHGEDFIFPKHNHYAKNILKECKIEEYKETEEGEKDFLKRITKYARKIRHKVLRIPKKDPNRMFFKLIYIRYADDWIILTNLKNKMVNDLKSKIANFLDTNLKATLSEEKTLITNLVKEKAHFLGFELNTNRKRKISRFKQKGKIIKARRDPKNIHAYPDQQRLLDRFCMKGICDENGFPREIRKLSNLEIFSIIEKYNSMLRGIVNYYKGYIKYKSLLSRWCYILIYSCIKTIAMKMKISTAKVFSKYGIKSKENEKTIGTIVTMKVEDKTYQKYWILETYKSLIKKDTHKEKKRIAENYWNLYNNIIPSYNSNDKADITNDDFLKVADWINLKTKTSLDMPCSICGSQEKIEMHHLNHIRKRKYSTIPKEETWTKIMGLRNRKQIPVCRDCHINLIHKGKYGGTRLGYLIPETMFDNRLINIENYLNKGIDVSQYCKSLEEKGWKRA